MTLVGFWIVNKAFYSAPMLNVIPISALTSSGLPVTKPISCPICENEFSNEEAKSEHLDRKHPGWATTMMFAFLRQIPRENG